MAIIALVAFAGGLIRGFTGFGGPAFILAILILFFNPYSVVAKILVVDFIASVYLFKAVYRQIDWRATASMVIPTLIFMPLGHWLLIELDPLLMKRVMALIISASCVMMLIGYRYQQPMTTPWLVLLGIVAGTIFGGTYIALVAVACILLGPYDKNAGRTLIVAWSWFAMLGFALLLMLSGSIDADNLISAAPGAVTYLVGTWIGSQGFRQSSEVLFRRVAISVLLLLSIVNLLTRF